MRGLALRDTTRRLDAGMSQLDSSHDSFDSALHKYTFEPHTYVSKPIVTSLYIQYPLQDDSVIAASSFPRIHFDPNNDPTNTLKDAGAISHTHTSSSHLRAEETK